MIDAFEDRSVWRAAGLAALLGGAPGCIGWPKVETSTRNQDRPVRSYEEVEVSPEARVLPGVTLDRGVDGQPERVRIEAVRERECMRIAHRVVDRTTVHERDVTSPVVWYAGYILGSVG